MAPLAGLAHFTEWYHTNDSSRQAVYTGIHLAYQQDDGSQAFTFDEPLFWPLDNMAGAMVGPDGHNHFFTA